MKKYNILYLFLLLMPLVSAQEQLSLSKCIEYAIENNVSVQQRRIELERHKIQVNTAKMSRLPCLDASVGETFSFARGTVCDSVITVFSSSHTSFT